MPDESTTPDLVELTRQTVEAGNDRDYDLLMSLHAPEAVEGMGTFEGRAAIRSYFQDWADSFEELRLEAEEILDLGNGVGFAVIVLRGRSGGSSAELRLRYAAVLTWIGGLIERTANYTDIDEARAAAERLAESRG